MLSGQLMHGYDLYSDPLQVFKRVQHLSFPDSEHQALKGVQHLSGPDSQHSGSYEYVRPQYPTAERISINDGTYSHLS